MSASSAPGAAATPSSTNFADAIRSAGSAPLRRAAVTTLQLNITRRCNLACHHCHVESGPKRTERVDAKVAARVIELLAHNPGIDTVDLTGGAPEMSEYFEPIVRAARALGKRVIDRCNLTILFEPGYEKTAEFLAEQGVDVVASLPCYTRENVDQQRGRGVFGRSIDGLQWLNQLGYAKPGTGLGLDLVYNPLGAFLPPAQAELEATYRVQLREDFGIEFDSLLTITNMPIKRFAHDLERDGQSDAYMALLVNHFNPATVPGLMCRSLVSIGYDGRIYDCDFNQMLEIDPPFTNGAGAPPTIFDIDDLRTLEGQPIATAPHCFGCTAGSGSSCGGSLA